MNAPAEPHGRVRAFGNQLIEIHLLLREELDRLRQGADAGDPPRDLRLHCLAFCTALGRHHTGEDGGAFAVLAQQAPELRPVIAELERDHNQVAGMLRDVEELLSADAPPQEVNAALDGLAALLESHFVYEEKKLVAALNTLDAGTTEELFGATIR
jgi:hypothetical protein